MGARKSCPVNDQWDREQLAQSTGLSPEEIDQYHCEYTKAAGRDGRIDRKEFLQLYSRLLGLHHQSSHHVTEQANRIFRTFDRDHSETLTFDEFLGFIVMMKHVTSPCDLINLLMRQNDALKDGQADVLISSEFGLELFRRLNEYYGLPDNTEDQCWKEVDSENQGYVAYEDLINYISRHRAYDHR